MSDTIFIIADHFLTSLEERGYNPVVLDVCRGEVRMKVCPKRHRSCSCDHMYLLHFGYVLSHDPIVRLLDSFRSKEKGNWYMKTLLVRDIADPDSFENLAAMLIEYLPSFSERPLDRTGKWVKRHDLI